MRQTASLVSGLVGLALITAPALIPTGPLYAQNTTSSIRVQVTDTNGAAVGGVPITITHVPTGRTQAFATNDQGVVAGVDTSSEESA